jgi:Uma2 family endonuclease
MSVTATFSEQRVLLSGISWQTYERLLADLGDRAIRLTYDRGNLEIVSPARPHERVKKLLGRMIETMTLELGVKIASGGSTTWKRRDLEKGLEPDECYWVQNEPRVRERDHIDLAIDPPPDLAIEVDISRGSIDRLGIHAALGVPEVWRFDRERLSIVVLQPDGEYAERSASPAFPWLPLGPFAGFLARRNATDETSWIREFRDWVRASIEAP